MNTCSHHVLTTIAFGYGSLFHLIRMMEHLLPHPFVDKGMTEQALLILLATSNPFFYQEIGIGLLLFTLVEE